MQATTPQPLAPHASSLTLVDGSGYIFRAYHALPPLTSPSGTPVGAVYGFVNMLLKLTESMRDSTVLVVFDAARKTFRNEMYADYKAHRPPPPDDLIPQFALVREAVEALGLPWVDMPDFEADDLIATYAKEAQAKGMAVTVVSSDKDLMQMIRPGVQMYDPMKGKEIGEKEVLEKFGVPPAKVCDVLALIGDSADNVPGVPGIGPKTAAELITEYGSLEGLLAHAGEIRQPKRRETIQSNLDKARLSHALVCLREDVPLPLPLSSLQPMQRDSARLLTFVQSHGFRTLAARLGGVVAGSREPEGKTAPSQARNNDPQAAYELIQTADVLARWVKEIGQKGIVAVDTETTSLDATRAELVGISLSTGAGRACYIPVGHKALGAGELALAEDLFAPAPMPHAPCPMPDQLPKEAVLAALKPLLEDAAVLKIGQNFKYDSILFARHGIHASPVDDTMLLSYSLGGGAQGHGMDELAERLLDHKTISYDEVTGTGKNRICFSQVPLEKALAYAAEDADITFRLWEVLKPRVAAEKLLTLYETVERPLVPVITAMELRGVRVDVGVLKELSRDFGARMGQLEEEIYALAGHPFNVGSPKQLGEVLFEEMQLPGGKKSSKTGAYSTDAYVLEELAEQGHALPVKVLEWRQLAKLKSTYADALAGQINPATGRVHTSYAMAATATGRLSSSDPNLQNIPIRTGEGRKIRNAFVASPGNRILSADYSQVELRLLAHVADVPSLKEAFRAGEDIHAITASQVFGVKREEVSADLRRSAKTINFGLIYGMGAHGLATRLGISRGDAAAYIEQYFRQYPGIRDYMEEMKAQAKKNGYVTTLFGRRCYVPGINDKAPGRKQGAERQAINAPLQGSAADIIKRAMIAVEAKLTESALPCQMLLQVHDELVFEVKEGAEEAALALVKPAMEGAAHLSVPLLVETGIGSHWGEAH